MWVFTGLRDGNRISIDYQTPGKEPLQRHVDPYHAVRYDGDWYIIGHCHRRNAVLTFSLSRILRASLRSETFTIPRDYNFHAITSSRFGVHWGNEEVQVKIWFSAAAAIYILERNWHPSQKISQQEDGSVLLELRVNHTIELKRWLLSWGKDARVLEPHAFRAGVQQEVEGMKLLYC